jgi:hypothetical protein
MRAFPVLAVIVAALVGGAPAVSDAGGPSAMGRGPALRGPSNRVPTFSPSPRAHHRFDRRPFFGATILPSERVVEVIVREIPVEVPVVTRKVEPAETAAAEPKFVLPPAPSEAAGSRTVVVQRGSKIEVQTFPLDR